MDTNTDGQLATVEQTAGRMADQPAGQTAEQRPERPEEQQPAAQPAQPAQVEAQPTWDNEATPSLPSVDSELDNNVSDATGTSVLPTVLRGRAGLPSSPRTRRFDHRADRANW